MVFIGINKKDVQNTEIFGRTTEPLKGYMVVTKMLLGWEWDEWNEIRILVTVGNQPQSE